VITNTRSAREQAASDASNVYDNSHKLSKRYSHIFACPNTRRAVQHFDELLRQSVLGKRVLEIGCGTGDVARRLASFGAAYVLAVDISETRIKEAKAHEIPGALEFAVADMSQPLEGIFDVIVGRAILHHLDYQEVLVRLSRTNLSEHGMMIFYEPLGSNPLMRLFQWWSRHAHTEDEHPFERRDLRWLKKTFPDFTLIPVNFLSLPLGALSSLIFKKPDNWMLRVADRVDQVLAHVPWLRPYFRYGIFIARKLW